jgi:succinoglycan biosynthesis protein ExoM
MSSPSQNPGGNQTRIDICVCTYRRPELELTLRSLGALEIPANATVRIVVADNDTQPSARTLVDALRTELPFEILYVHCPASNISVARNACLDSGTGEYLAFIDDDETTSVRWLVELTEVAQATGADAVLGPVRAVYSDAAPGWMRRGDFHSTSPVFVGAQIRTGYTCNVLLRRASPHIAGRRFSLAAGQTGGEDTEYFTQMYQAGGRIAYAPRALVVEPVPQARARFAWLAKRRFRSGQTHGRLLGHGRGAAGLFRQMALAAAKAVYCYGAAAALAVVAQHRNRYALRGVLHTGVVVGLLGIREIRLYGKSQPLGRHSNAA